MTKNSSPDFGTARALAKISSRECGRLLSPANRPNIIQADENTEAYITDSYGSFETAYELPLT